MTTDGDLKSCLPNKGIKACQASDGMNYLSIGSETSKMLLDFFFPGKLGKWSNLTFATFVQMGWRKKPSTISIKN